MFYNLYAELCSQKNVSPSKAADEMGINRSTVTLWKKNGAKPRQEILIKIAEYFGVSIDYLLGNEVLEKSLDEQLGETDFALLNGAKCLSEDGKKAVLRYINFLKQEEMEGKEK